jgi:hypothetical protein
MSSESNIDWASVLAALAPIAVSLATLVLGCFAFSIAKEQKRIAAEKLKLDLFDRRFKCYEKISKTLDQVTQNAKLTKVDFIEYRLNVFETRWLFGDEVFSFLDGEYKNKLLLLTKLGSKKQLNSDEIEQESTLLNEITHSFDEEVTALFEPYLRILYK